MKLGGLPIVGMKSDSMERNRTSPDYRYETAYRSILLVHSWSLFVNCLFVNFGHFVRYMHIARGIIKKYPSS